MSGLRVEGVDVRVGERNILKSVGFSASAGSVTGLLGPNGAGKSTLIGALLGQRRLVAGAVRFDGGDLPGMAPAERAKICAHVEQTVGTTERLTVRDVVALGRIPYQSAWQARAGAEDEGIVADAMAELGISAFAARLYHTLSGGEQQRVQLARALAQQPKLLLLDEPTSHLDIEAQLLALELLRRQAAAGNTVVLAMHDLNLAARYCDHLVVLKSGKVVVEGTPDAVLNHELLLDVYGVYATIVRLPGIDRPLVVYERARSNGSAPETG